MSDTERRGQVEQLDQAELIKGVRKLIDNAVEYDAEPDLCDAL